VSSFLYGLTSETPNAPRSTNAYVVIPRATFTTAMQNLNDPNPANTQQGREELENAGDAVGGGTPAFNILESLIGLIPLEAAAFWSFVSVQYFTASTTDSAEGADPITTLTVTDVDALKITALAAVVIAIVSCLAGKMVKNSGGIVQRLKQSLDSSRDWVELVIPAGAFLIWAYIIDPSVLRQSVGRGDIDVTWGLAVFAGFLLFITATALGLKKSPAEPDA
jgi:hypothetical protein